MTSEERRMKMQRWFDRNANVKVSNSWNGVQRGDTVVWDETGEHCMFVAHAVDEHANTEWWTFASPDREELMHASQVYFVWAGGPPLHGML